ncbi:uncharacterized protein DEA37_0007227 [Paragonimus westermani]|uniref:BHLH domain-containing protein n=1 Tax=Paragonimus westermani TaxID=34504 RepID=A0A5J4P3K2_9TREM|nr:uncharacterized protein DEA37_0007227 [Paragonimus westermani]
MTRHLNSSMGKNMHTESYDLPYGEDDDDDDFDDDDDIDGYDGLSDFDEDDDVQGRSASRHGTNGSMNDRLGGGQNEFRRQRSLSEGGANQLDGGDDNRRDHHNQLERKRRASIKTSYNDLREVIPSLRGTKASRAVILQRAVDCIEDLVRQNRDHVHCVEELRRKNDLLYSRNQVLERCVQRFDDEEATSASYCSSFTLGSSAGNGTLRLYPGTISASGASGTGSGLPVYRLLPQDSTDRGSLSGIQGNPSTRAVSHGATGPSASVVSLPSRMRTSSVSQLVTTNNTSAHNSAFSGMNVLSAAATLMASSRSAFSSSPSSGGDTAQSSSQRSSPGCFSSSSSSSNASNASTTNRTEASEERSLVIDTACLANIDSCEVAPTSTSKTEIAQAPRTSSTFRPISPPSIFLNVPVRPSTTVSSVDPKLRQRHSISVPMTESPDPTFDLDELTKRRRMI